MTKRRPDSVTVICWLAFLMAGLSLNAMVRGIGPEVSGTVAPGVSVQLVMASVGVSVLVYAVLGIFMLRGANWARWAFLMFIASGFVGFTIQGNVFGAIISAAKTGAFVYFLTRDDAVAFFRPGSVVSGSVQAQPAVQADDHAPGQ